jgi:hypothetical protein
MVTTKSRILTISALILISSIVLIVYILFLGFSDPIAAGEPIWQKKLFLMRLPGQTEKILWLRENLDQTPFSVRVIGSLESGDSDSAFGIVISQSDGEIMIMISPLGYISIWHESASINTDNKFFYLPWQTWPHIHTGDSENEIYVRLTGDTISVRVNRELLWEMSEIDRVDRIGIMGVSFGDDTTINFRLAEISNAYTLK